MNSVNRLNWVDTAKGLSILLVVMLYATNGAGEATGDVGLFHYLIGFATPFRMPEFFLISGLFLASVINRPWPKFLDRRALHYFYFYLLWAAIHIGLKIGLASANPIAAASDMALALVQPYGVLWFIYVLALTGVATKVLHELRVPKWLTFAAAAVMSMATIKTGSYAVDQFAEYFVFFFSGYALAPLIFKFVQWGMNNLALAAALVLAWGVTNGYFVFAGGFIAEPGLFSMGYAEHPVLHFALALSGSIVLCLFAGILSKTIGMGWLRYIGERSLAIYVAFVLPLGFLRLALVKLNLITDVTLLTAVTMIVSIILPLVALWVVNKIKIGQFLFVRPNWAQWPENGKKSDQTIKYGAPAE
jgi:uncharacterized membrane protein YcfT